MREKKTGGAAGTRVLAAHVVGQVEAAVVAGEAEQRLVLGADRARSPKKHHHSKKPRADDPAAPEAADDEAAASSDSDDEAAPPAVQEDEEFEETLTAVLAAVGDEEEPTLAVSSKALGGLEVEHESLVSLKEELLTLQRAHERAVSRAPDAAAVDDDVREEVLVKLEVVNERLATVEEVRDEITGSIKGWGIDALVVARDCVEINRWFGTSPPNFRPLRRSRFG
jgi:hypothetical protein